MPVLPSYRNQSLDLHSKSIDWFLQEGYNGTYQVNHCFCDIQSTRMSEPACPFFPASNNVFSILKKNHLHIDIRIHLQCGQYLRLKRVHNIASKYEKISDVTFSAISILEIIDPYQKQKKNHSLDKKITQHRKLTMGPVFH